MIRAYPVRRKKKSVELCEAFVKGANRAAEGAVFYGVDDSNEADWVRVQVSGVDYYYIDNSYFDVSRGTYFRVTRNALQHTGDGATNGSRLRALGVKVAPWRSAGSHIVVCQQSHDFMRRLGGYTGDWLTNTVAQLKEHTNRALRIRTWDSDKLALATTLERDLHGAWALVTYSSAAAITALQNGIPIVSAAGAAATMSGRLQDIHDPLLADGRERFLGVLADNQWSVTEMANGKAWAHMTYAATLN